jgi:hypothetical protein
MAYAYSNCYNLTGNPVCGNKVTDISYAYDHCSNLHGTMKIFSKNIKAVAQCFLGRNTSNRLNIYVYNGSTTCNTIRNKITRTDSITGTNIVWTEIDTGFYNSEQNIYIYYIT